MDNEAAREPTVAQVAAENWDSQRGTGRLTDMQKMLIEQRIANEKPSTGVAYLLCLFFGAFGAHRLYLGRKGSGIAMLILGITIIGLFVTGLWAFIDLFLIPSIIREKVDALRQRLTLEAMV